MEREREREEKQYHDERGERGRGCRRKMVLTPPLTEG
jgi:hypothetical protein